MLAVDPADGRFLLTGTKHRSRNTCRISRNALAFGFPRNRGLTPSG
jgi:hypothetical protein